MSRCREQVHAEARRRALRNTVEADKLRGEFVDPRGSRITLEAYALRRLDQRTSLRPRTSQLYRFLLRRYTLPRLGHVELGRLTPGAIRAWHADIARTVSPNGAAKSYRLLRTILGTAVEDELLIRNPCSIRGLAVERSKERPVATVERVVELADAIAPHLRALVLVASFTGLRLGDCSACSAATSISRTRPSASSSRSSSSRTARSFSRLRRRRRVSARSRSRRR
jgi:hypothetical protein